MSCSPLLWINTNLLPYQMHRWISFQIYVLLSCVYCYTLLSKCRFETLFKQLKFVCLWEKDSLPWGIPKQFLGSWWGWILGWTHEWIKETLKNQCAEDWGGLVSAPSGCLVFSCTYTLAGTMSLLTGSRLPGNTEHTEGSWRKCEE